MAVKNLQTLASCVANIHGVRVTGMECMDSMRFGTFPTPILSLPRLPQSGPYPTATGPDAELSADNAAAAQAVTRAGRSERGAGEHPGARLSKKSWQQG